MTTTETPVRAPYRPYPVTVARVQRLAEHFVRITFTGEELEHFGTAGLDQRIKLVLPDRVGAFADIGQYDAAADWYDRWRALPAASRNVFRTYTVRRIDPLARELDVDIVVHEDPGPAGAWAAAATVGDPMVVVGPDARSPHARAGIDWHPGTARSVLLAGDETALPAIAAIVETLPFSLRAQVLVEVPGAGDVLPLTVHGGVRVTWLPRGDRPHGEALVAAVGSWADRETDLVRAAAAPRRQIVEEIDVDRELLWDSPEDAEGEFYAWIAGEAAAVKAARRILVGEHGIDRRRVAFMGYWRAGQGERTE